MFPGYLQKHTPRIRQDDRTIGIIGQGRGTGVTHFCILLANYLSGVKRKKTAVLEWNTHHDFEKMRRICQAGKMQKFRVLEVDYYANADAAVLLECMKQNYHHIIIDFGEMTEGNRPEFFRCDQTWTVVSLSEWQMDACWKLCEETGEVEKERWKIFVAFGSEETRKEWKRRRNLSLIRIPLSVDAFTITGELLSWFSHLMDDR